MKSFVGLDLGTSAVKALQRFENGETSKVSVPYTEPLPGGWIRAAEEALSRLDWTDTAGIGLAAQVGTYVVDGRDVIGWNDRAGEDEIRDVLALHGAETWDREAGMRHPPLISYPLPRLMYIRKRYPDVHSVCQPKELLVEALTGEKVTDPWSWRGLSTPGTGRYSRKLLASIGEDEALLPRILQPAEQAGVTRGNGKVPAGIPVYTGLNDFYASLLGMGMGEDELFDITGTSEHVGVIERGYHPDDELVSGPWLTGFAHYGVTASSGPSLTFGRKVDETLFRVADAEAAGRTLEKASTRKPPVFLPYVNGERAPIWDPEARGVWFGISAECEPADLAYAVMEGVCFSVLQVYERLGRPAVSEMKVSGGAAANALMNRMKAELIGCPAVLPAERDTTALGAAMTAMIGSGYYADRREAAAECAAAERVLPDGRLKGWLADRYGIYCRLYPALKECMNEWRKLG